jgi:hypothetical protein
MRWNIALPVLTPLLRAAIESFSPERTRQLQAVFDLLLRDWRNIPISLIDPSSEPDSMLNGAGEPPSPRLVPTTRPSSTAPLKQC